MDHAHDRPYKPAEKRRLRAALLVNLVVMAVEFAGGFLTGSLALLSDAGHMFTHVFALGMGYFAMVMAGKSFNDRKTFGYYRAEILAAFVNALFLLLAVGVIAWEAVGRLRDPRTIKAPEMIGIALIGLAANLASFFLLRRDAGKDLNIRAAFVHVLADTASSVLIVLGGVLIYYQHWYFLDPVLSLLISVLIFVWAWRLLRESADVLLEAAPKSVRNQEVRERLLQEIEEIRDVHDLHVWVITGRLYAATLHVVVGNCSVREGMEIASRVRAVLKDRFAITHANVQLEAGDGDCGHKAGIGF
jgi:cobalt-zinc-cadmium efflux system protein